MTNVTRNFIEVVKPSQDIPTRVKCTTTRVGALFLDVKYNHIQKLMVTGVCDLTSLKSVNIFYIDRRHVL
jgi:hypothetical protein